MENLDTRQKILQAAVDLISEKGYHDVSVREICARAGVTKPVLYYYFKDKEDVLAELIQEGNRRFHHLIDKHILPDSPFIKQLEGLFEVYIRYTEENFSHIAIAINVELSPLPERIKTLSREKTIEVTERILPVFQQGVKEGVFSPSDDLKMLAVSFTSPLSVFILQSVLHHDPIARMKEDLTGYFQFWKKRFLREKV
ncbi:MAG: TetR/AcrR family transcriptional regulator [Ignavibacteriales bacterium]|nr:MAG: TetR/AcrR family transcriptional regulator [Ignavibacteriales bacterium]